MTEASSGSGKEGAGLDELRRDEPTEQLHCVVPRWDPGVPQVFPAPGTAMIRHKPFFILFSHTVAHAKHMAWLQGQWCAPPNPQAHKKSRGGCELRSRKMKGFLESDGGGVGLGVGALQRCGHSKGRLVPAPETPLHPT